MTTSINVSVLALTACAAMVCAGCSPQKTLMSVPQELVDKATIPGMPHVRTWGDDVNDVFVDSLANSVRQYHAHLAAHPQEKVPATADILAISGGADDGAFGAGLLCGWTERGDRPQFRLVTGISTGALIAPLAFLGPKYDSVLRDAYLKTKLGDVVESRGLLAILTRDGLADTDPLGRLIQKWVTDDTIKEIAAEHAKGRRLLVATVNLEAQRPVIWDLGAIASSGHPKAAELFRTVMLASASIPGAFEPQYINVEAGGKTYEEMHVDGGAVAQVFLYGAGVDLQTIAQRSGLNVPRRPVRLFVLRNGRFDPEHKPMKALFAPIAGRSISTMIKMQGLNDMIRLYFRSQLEGMDFHMAAIPSTFNVKAEEMFEPAYMDALFKLAYDQAKAGYPWSKTPPHVEPKP